MGFDETAGVAVTAAEVRVLTRARALNTARPQVWCANEQANFQLHQPALAGTRLFALECVHSCCDMTAPA